MMNEMKMNKREEAINNAQNALGQDFKRAELFWKQLKNKGKLRTSDYVEMTRSWIILKELLRIKKEAEKDKVDETNAMPASLSDICHVLRGIYAPAGVKATDIDSWTDIEKSEFIETILNNYSAQTTTEVLTKKPTKIIKMSLDDIQIIPTGLGGHVAVFSSANASVFTTEQIKAHKNEAGKITAMRIVESSEDGISRMFEENFDKEVTHPCVTVHMGQTAQSEEEKALLYNKKLFVFQHGFTDTHTGVHYLFGFQNPSSCRKANFMFIKADNWNEVFDFWYKITGTKNKDGFVKAFGDEVVMAKLLARISTRGSNSFDVSKVNPVWYPKTRDFKVLYCPDAEYTIDRPYRQLVAPGKMEDKITTRPITPADGQGVISVSDNAILSVTMRVITENEYNEFVVLWADHKANGGTLATVQIGSRLWVLIEKMPKVWQIRHGEKKGILVMSDIENLPNVTDPEAIAELRKMNKDLIVDENGAVCLSEYGVVIPESVRKFIGGDWHEYPLEICNFLKKKKEWVALNPQFIEALEFDDPNALRTIVDYWLNFMEEAVDDISKALQFHNIVAHEEDSDSDSNLTTVLSTSASLMNDAQVQKWRIAQFEKVTEDMRIGRIMVPGMYSYMICDPYFFFSSVFKIDIPHLQKGEYYHNAKECECGLFRSPLIHPFEAQKVQLANNEIYWYLKDVVIFNGYDGLWDRMGGGDFDGDTCAIIPTDDRYGFGKIIVDGIRNIPFDIWEPAQKAIKVHFTPDISDEEAMNNFWKYLATSAKVDDTGIITNHASRALDIANHLRSAIHFAKMFKCETISFIHPRAFGIEKHFGTNYVPVVDYDANGVRSYYMRGFIEGKYTKDGGIEWDDTKNVVLGVKTLEEVKRISDCYMELVEILRILQGREIDGAKTGVYAAGVSGQDFIEAVKVRISPNCMLTRQVSLGRRPEDKEDTATLNSFVSLSPLSRMHDYIQWYLYNVDGTMKDTYMRKLKENGVNKSFLLNQLLTEEEKKILEVPHLMADGTQKNLIEMMRGRKSIYNTKVRNLKKDLEGEIGDEKATETTLAGIKAEEKAVLETFATALNVSMTSLAEAAYLATYNKDSSPNEGLSYGWLLFDEIIAVFSRNNDKFGWFKLPNNVETACVKDNVLYVNGKKYRDIQAYDCDSVLIRNINGKVYGWIHRAVSVVADKTVESTATVYGNETFTIGAYGLQHHCGSVEEWKNRVRANGFEFDITMDAQDRAILSVNGQSISALMAGKEFSLNMFNLNNKRVRVVNTSADPIKWYKNSIGNLKVIIVGDAQ